MVSIYDFREVEVKRASDGIEVQGIGQELLIRTNLEHVVDRRTFPDQVIVHDLVVRSTGDVHPVILHHAIHQTGFVDTVAVLGVDVQVVLPIGRGRTVASQTHHRFDQAGVVVHGNPLIPLCGVVVAQKLPIFVVLINGCCIMVDHGKGCQLSGTVGSSLDRTLTDHLGDSVVTIRGFDHVDVDHGLARTHHLRIGTALQRVRVPDIDDATETCHCIVDQAVVQLVQFEDPLVLKNQGTLQTALTDVNADQIVVLGGRSGTDRTSQSVGDVYIAGHRKTVVSVGHHAVILHIVAMDVAACLDTSLAVHDVEVDVVDVFDLLDIPILGAMEQVFDLVVQRRCKGPDLWKPQFRDTLDRTVVAVFDDITELDVQRRQAVNQLPVQITEDSPFLHPEPVHLGLDVDDVLGRLYQPSIAVRKDSEVVRLI